MFNFPPYIKWQLLELKYEKKTILVIGTSGSVGSETVKALKKFNTSDSYNIRWGVRNIDKCRNMMLSGELSNLELVHLDLNKLDTLDAAFNGVTKVFLILGLHSDRSFHVKRVLDCCKKAKVEHFLFLSLVGCTSKSFNILKQFREAEELIESSGIVYTLLRTVFFQENLFYYSPMIQQNVLQLPIGMGKFAPLCTFDVGEIAASILLDNVRIHAYQIYDLTGPELHDGNSICAILSKNLGKEIIFSPVSFLDGHQYLQSVGFPSWVCNGFKDLYEIIANNQAAIISQDGESILKRKMSSIDWVVNKNKEKFLYGTAMQQQPFAKAQVQPQQMAQQLGGMTQKQHEEWQFQQQQQRKMPIEGERIWPK